MDDEKEIEMTEVDIVQRAGQTEGGTLPEVEPEQTKAHSRPHKEKQEPEEQISELGEQLLRKRAEFENYKKRVEGERSEFFKYAAEKVIVDLLPILDSFDRALHPDHITEETRPIFDGFSLIYKQMFDVLKKEGMTEINTEGEMFSPHLHQAVSKEKKEDVPPGMIVKEYQKGYMLHKKVIRPYMVVVSE